MSLPSALEIEMLELVNLERTSRGLDELIFDRNLNRSSEDHSEWMQDTGTFSHTGQGGSSATERMRDAGFEFTGSWRSAENIAFGSEGGAAGYSDDVSRLHDALMNSAGHRANILNPNLETIGIGIEVGHSSLSGGRDTVVITQNFATSTARNDPIVTFQNEEMPVAENTQSTTPAAPTRTASNDDSAPDLSGAWVERLDRLQTKAEKFQDRLDKWEGRVEAADQPTNRDLNKVDLWEGRLDALQTRVEKWVGRLEERWERRAESTNDTSDDGVPAANLEYLCDDIQSWDVSWSHSCDVA